MLPIFLIFPLLAQERPQALQRVFEPSGPFRINGVSFASTPQLMHRLSVSTAIFLERSLSFFPANCPLSRCILSAMSRRTLYLIVLSKHLRFFFSKYRLKISRLFGSLLLICGTSRVVVVPRLNSYPPNIRSAKFTLSNGTLSKTKTRPPKESVAWQGAFEGSGWGCSPATESSVAARSGWSSLFVLIFVIFCLILTFKLINCVRWFYFYF